MSEEIEFDVNLLYLQNLLFSLDNFHFDKDVIVLLNELSSLVNKKIFLDKQLTILGIYFMIKMRDGFKSRRYLSRFNVRVYSTEPPEEVPLVPRFFYVL